MLNPTQIEAAFKEFLNNLPKCAHDGVIKIDLRVLHDFGILDSLHEDELAPDDLTQYFHVIESAEKVTLFNEQFVVWIVPRMEQSGPMTCVMIALNHQGKARLEVAFTTHGVYNTPQYVLRILQYFLVDVLETEEAVLSIEKKN